MRDTWFSVLTGFPEGTWADTRAQLEVDGQTLRSLVNGRAFGIGTLETPSVAELRQRVADVRARLAGPLRVSAVAADVTDLHRDSRHRHATFQVASQFNLLEMTGPDVTPEDGVTRYASDRTQGPACAIAAGAATIYRNYFAPVDGHEGQTSTRQIDCLRDLGHALCEGDCPQSGPGQTFEPMWTMRNGYALCTEAGLARITAQLAAMSASERDGLRDLLRVGVHADVEVTAGADSRAPHVVTQVFCSALPVAYTAVPSARWQAFATLVLEGAYEATLLAAALTAARTGSRLVFLTRLGGGVFDNDPAWIDAAMARAFDRVRDLALDVRVVRRQQPAEHW
ncbi:MAG: hypothetical protein IT181_13575 [Acidobacteria bacterium]|nr:hypothetical protein [Acidobacteriota bacterium]